MESRGDKPDEKPKSRPAIARRSVRSRMTLQLFTHADLRRNSVISVVLERFGLPTTCISYPGSKNLPVLCGLSFERIVKTNKLAPGRLAVIEDPPVPTAYLAASIAPTALSPLQ